MLAPFAGQPFPPQQSVDDLGTLVQHKITVTNTGALDADDVVLGDPSFLDPFLDPSFLDPSFLVHVHVWNPSSFDCSGLNLVLS